MRHRGLQHVLLAALAASLLTGPATAQTEAPKVGLTGKWLAEDIRGGGVIDSLQSYVDIAEDGTISGSGGCNRMIGKASVSGDTIAFGPLGGTRMACPPAIMDQEAKFFAALEDAHDWQVDTVARKLTFRNAEGQTILVLSRM